MSTGFELLSQALMDAGFKTAKIKANEDLINTVITFVAKSDENRIAVIDSVVEAYEQRAAEYAEARKKEQLECNKYFRMRYDLETRLNEVERERREYEEKAKAAEKVLEFETPEARDTMRKFYIFRDSCDIQSPQNNTVFINGMAAILSGIGVQMNGGDGT